MKRWEWIVIPVTAAVWAALSIFVLHWSWGVVVVSALIVTGVMLWQEWRRRASLEGDDDTSSPRCDRCGGPGEVLMRSCAECGPTLLCYRCETRHRAEVCDDK